MNAPSSPWNNGSNVSRFWSAKGDERCAPPESNDYKDWSLMQLKREITQRQLKTNPRRRNKDAFVRVLLLNDQEQIKTSSSSAYDDDDNSVMFISTSSSEVSGVPVASGELQQETYGGTDRRRQHHQQKEQQQELSYCENSEQQHTVGAIQSTRLISPATAPAAPIIAPNSMPNSVPVGAKVTSALESEVESFQGTKRQRYGHMGHEKNEEKENYAVALEMMRTESTAAQLKEKGMTEYWRQKLSLQSTRLEIESRRLELEIKSDQRDCELHAVQLALAQEQLRQAEITTQKMKTEWMVDQMIQKKRLKDAGISQNDSATLGMYVS